LALSRFLPDFLSGDAAGPGDLEGPREGPAARAFSKKIDAFSMVSNDSKWHETPRNKVWGRTIFCLDLVVFSSLFRLGAGDLEVPWEGPAARAFSKKIDAFSIVSNDSKWHQTPRNKVWGRTIFFRT